MPYNRCFVFSNVVKGTTANQINQTLRDLALTEKDCLIFMNVCRPLYCISDASILEKPALITIHRVDIKKGEIKGFFGEFNSGKTRFSHILNFVSYRMYND